MHDKKFITITVLALLTLFVQLYDPLFSSLMGKSDYLKAVGGSLNVIPIALFAFHRGLRGGLWSACVFSVISIILSLISPEHAGGFYSSAARVTGYLLAGIITAFLARPVREKEESSGVGRESMVSRREHVRKLETLAQTVANDIKPPLIAIRNTLKDLQNDDIDEAQRRRIGIISRETDRLSGVVADYLDFAAPKVTHTHRVDVASILDEVVNRIKPEAERIGVRLVLKRPDLNGFTPGDRDRLSRMFLNIILNGLQASEGGGQVEIELQHRRSAGLLDISISDTGAGIPDDILSRIFEPFFTTRLRGSGLGLSIARTIAEEHSGSITAENLPAAGTRFTVTLPFSEKTLIGR